MKIGMKYPGQYFKFIMKLLRRYDENYMEITKLL